MKKTNNFLEQKESQTLEFKKSLAERKEILETISAFAGTEGGIILVGVKENKDGSIKEITGIEIKGKIIENLTNEIKQNTDPVIFPSVKIEKIQGKDVLLIEVEKHPSKLVFAKDKAFARVGRTNRRLTSEEIRRLAKESAEYNFTESINEEAKLEDIDEEKVRWFLRKAKAERTFDADTETSLTETLKKLKLTKNHKLTNAAVLLFSKDPNKYILQSEVRCGRFKGIKPLEFEDMEVIKGNLIDQVDRIISFVKRNLKVKETFDESIERKEEWEYPLLALKEGIVNAVCHRDYALSSNVQVRIFDDRLEIWSPGGLPYGLTVAKLKGKHESQPRNKEIANTFFMIKLIEQWGTGTNRIIELCKEYQLPEPDFEDTKTSFIVTFRKYRVTEEILKELNERQRKAVEYLLENKKITNKKYRELNPNISDRTALNDFNELIKKSIIIAKREKKYRYYMLQ